MKKIVAIVLVLATLLCTAAMADGAEEMRFPVTELVFGAAVPSSKTSGLRGLGKVTLANSFESAEDAEDNLSKALALNLASVRSLWAVNLPAEAVPATVDGGAKLPITACGNVVTNGGNNPAGALRLADHPELVPAIWLVPVEVAAEDGTTVTRWVAALAVVDDGVRYTPSNPSKPADSTETAHSDPAEAVKAAEQATYTPKGKAPKGNGSGSSHSGLPEGVTR